MPTGKARRTTEDGQTSLEKDRPVKAVRGNGRGRGHSPEGAPAQPDLRVDLRQFVAEHPQGWSHDDWLGLLSRLGERGHDVGDPDTVGIALEREGLAARLAGVPGVGPQRIRSIVERYGSLSDLRQAGPEDLSRSAGIPRALAERIWSAC